MSEQDATHTSSTVRTYAAGVPKRTIQLWELKQDILERFDVLAQREDNWNGYDSKKPTASTIVHAKNLMAEFLDAIVSAGYSWLTPFISSDEDGYITIEWHKGERELHFDIEENEVEYTKLWGPNTDMKIHSDLLNRDDYLTLWKWLLDG